MGKKVDINQNKLPPPPPSVLPDGEKHEKVDETLRALAEEKRKREEAQRNRGWRRFLRILFWPLIAPFRALKKVKLPLTIKMVLVFSIFFSVILIGYSVFIVNSVQDSVGDKTNLITMTAVIVSVAVAAFAALSGVISSWVLNPIRKITARIDEITAQDLSKRLEPVDTQDELMELTNRINGMLDNLETTFLRQENFIADASHELKTPISVISGYVNLLRRWGANDERILGEGIEAICRESENMQVMVEQLLLLARLGKIHMHKMRFDVDEVLKDTVESYCLTNPKKQKIEYHGPGSETLVETDRALLIELVRILVNNAVKYTPEGGSISASVAVAGSELRIAVSDTGAGIAPEDLPQIYDRFFRCDRSRGRESGGTGLGLTIAKSIADTLGGEISVESVLGKGTTFTVTLM